MAIDYQFTYNGATFGAGTTAGLITALGLESLPDIAVGDQPRANVDGEFINAYFARGRTVEFELEIIEGPAAATRAALTAATVNQKGVEKALTYQLPGQTPRLIYCRPVAREIPTDLDFSFGMQHAHLQLRATDPRIYDATLTSLAIPMPTAGTGLTFPATAPFSFGAGGIGGQAVATNTGNYETWWTASITGPIDTPIVQHVESGRSLQINLVLAVGDVLTVNADPATRTILLNGVSRYGSLSQGSSPWFSLAPGTNTVQLRSVGGGSGTLTFTFRSAWL